MNIDHLIAKKELFFFDLDDVLYPEQDYLLQVYYLFAHFIEYETQGDASAILAFMKTSYLESGPADVFSKTAEKFSLPEKYAENFEKLHHTARLPLKLLLFADVLDFLNRLKAAGKKIIIITDGNPEMQLNKIKQLEWNGLEQNLTVYFAEELGLSREALIQRILKEMQLNESNALYFVHNKFDISLNVLNLTLLNRNFLNP